MIPAGKDLTVVQPSNAERAPAFLATFLGGKHDLAMAVCYCSVLDECWVVTARDLPAPIESAAACPIAAAERFQH